MAKKGKGNGGFSNYAAKTFNEEKLKKVKRMAEPEIWDILEADFDIILGQLIAFINHDKGSKFPKYIKYIFYNLSSAKYLMHKIKANKKNWSKIERKALRILIETGYKETYMKNTKLDQSENQDRVKLLMKAYFYLYPKRVMYIKKKLKVTKHEACELSMFTQDEPYHTVINAAKILDKSSVGFKKKIAVLKDLVKNKGKLIDWYGAFLTINRNNSFVEEIYELMVKSKPEKRYRILGAYATCFKYNPGHTKLLTSDTFLKKKNLKMMKSLVKEDIGFKKAFAPFFAKIERSKDKKKKEKAKKKDKSFGL